MNIVKTIGATAIRQEPENPTVGNMIPMTDTDSTVNPQLAVTSLIHHPYRIVCGDCLGMMRQMPSANVDICVTSPPYNLRNSTGGGMKSDNGHSKWANAALARGYSNHDDKMPHNEYVAWQRECLTEMMRVTKDDGAIFYNHKWRVQKGLLQDRNDIVYGFPVRQIIIWKRIGGINFNPGYFLPTYEVIYLIAKSGFKLAPKTSALGDVWDVPQERNNPHPAPFPVALAERMIASTNARLVLDPFMGSGTTAVAALRLSRDFIGIDNSAEYCWMARERVEGVRSELFPRRKGEHPFKTLFRNENVWR